jgi:protein arginine kinase
MNIDHMLSRVSPWLAKEDNDPLSCIVSSRIRLARNIRGYRFIAECPEEDMEKLQNLVEGKIESLKTEKSFSYLSLRDLCDLDIELLVERHLISKELAKAEWPCAVAFDCEEITSIMINEEDHLRIQVMDRGLQIQQLWEQIYQLDDQIDEVLPFAFHSQFGYLTSCPTNTGTGMRVSVMLHLPALRMTQQMSKIYKGISKYNLILRGLYGEGTAALGDFFQISNQITLGEKEESTIAMMESIVPQIVQYEEQVRQKMLENDSHHLERKIQQSWETLSQSTSLSSRDAVHHLSHLRLGCHLNLTPLSIGKINELFLFSQKAHLAKQDITKWNNSKENEIRAEFFHSALKG